MAREYKKPRWLDAWIIAWALAACAMPYTKVQLPLEPMDSDMKLGYATEQDRHDIRLYVPGHQPTDGVRMVEHWTAKAFPFGTIRFSAFMNGPYRFQSRGWFPRGLPEKKGDRCALQEYEGVKPEGGKLLEFKKNGWPYIPLEFFGSEQHAWRVKCDLDVTPAYDGTNEAGY